MKFFSILFFLFLGIVPGMKAMESSSKFVVEYSPQKAKNVPSSFGFDCVGTIVESIKRCEEGDSWVGAWYTLTDKQFVEEAIAAKKRGVKVSLYVDRYTMSIDAGKDAIEMLKNAGVQVNIFTGEGMLHTKLALIIRNVTVDEKTVLKKTIMHGSSNLTKSARENNDELIEIFPDDSDLYNDFEEFVKKNIAPYCVPADQFDFHKYAVLNDPNSPAKQILGTPKKGQKSLLTNKNSDIWRTFIERIKKAQDGDEIVFMSMTFTHYGLLNALVRAVQSKVKVSLLLDKTSLVDRMIAKLKDAAENGVDIRIACDDDGKQHTKALGIHRQLSNSYIVAKGSGNAVWGDSKILNHWVMQHQSERKDFADIKNIFNNRIKDSTVFSLADALKRFNDSKKRKPEEGSPVVPKKIIFSSND